MANEDIQSQISTANLTAAAGVGASEASSAPPLPPADPADDHAPNSLYGPAGPQPHGIEQAASSMEDAEGLGVSGEKIMWQGRYSLRNFAGRFVLVAAISILWLVYTLRAKPWTDGDNNGPYLLWVLAGILVAGFLLAMLRRVLLARFGHFYRLTNRRLFVSTGVFRRREDQVELLRVKDVFLDQTFGQRLLSIGKVVVMTEEPHFPMLNLIGVTDPKSVMDLVWHHARAERDERSTKVEAL